MIFKRIYPITLISILLFAGCAKKEFVVIDSDKKKEAYQIDVGTRSNDARAVIKTGKILKIFIRSYVSSQNILIGAHDVYFYVENPGFKAGISEPINGYRSGVVKENDKLPIYLSPNEIDRSDLKNDEVITKYLKEINEKTRQDIFLESEKIDGGKE